MIAQAPSRIVASAAGAGNRTTQGLAEAGQARPQAAQAQPQQRKPAGQLPVAARLRGY
jgi:hypothetical protein